MQTYSFLLLSVLSCQLFHNSYQFTCDSNIYCKGELLDKVQSAELFNDSKTFVDMIQVHSSKETLKNFETLKQKTNNNPTKEDIRQFVRQNFVDEGELEPWTPPDHNKNPSFFSYIRNRTVLDFARALVSVWPLLGRRISCDVFDNPDRHSLIPLPNNFVVPGGRFRELYYWDSYWIIKGLLISEMRDTARGMLENLLWLVKTYGFVPNGNRVYYLNRSQPPLLTRMVGLYMRKTQDLRWLGKNVYLLDKELTWWLTNRNVSVERFGVNYTLAHYSCLSGTPRPESYIEDIRTCETFKDEDMKKYCYRDLKGAAESGWDFSSRWIFNSSGGFEGNLSDIHTGRVVPVDLNAILCRAFTDLASFYKKVGSIHKSIRWDEKADEWKRSITKVLYDKEDGIWYDYDLVLSRHRKMFYPSNFAPLWTKMYPFSDINFGQQAVKYLKTHRLDTYPGGVPASLDNTGQQWDFPNAWPPSQEIIILGLDASGDGDATRLAKDLATRWISANILGYKNTGKIFEKYDAVNAGNYGGGGEYSVQDGFGWTNGVALSLIHRYYRYIEKVPRIDSIGPANR